VSQPLESSHEVRHGFESNLTFAKLAAGNDLSLETDIALSKRQLFAHPDLSPGTHQRFPFKRGVELLCKKQLAAALKKLFHGWILRRERLRLLAASVSE